MLRPLVHLLISKSVSYQQLSTLLKSLYVEVAANDFMLDGKQATDSRINLLTGVHRKEISRLRQEASQQMPIPSPLSIGTQLVALWITDERFLDGAAKPRPLPRYQSQIEEVSFEALVRTINKDIRPRSILDEWLRLGIVYIDENDNICLKTEAFVPESGFEEKAYFFGQNLHDHVKAAAHNLLDEKPPFFDRSVFYESLTPQSVEELTAMSHKLAMQALQAVNKRAKILQDQDQDSPEATHRINFGSYIFNAEKRDEPNE